jgi:hypothetical protein
MIDNDMGCTFEWEEEFNEWLVKRGVVVFEKNDSTLDYPDIKKEYSENFVIQLLLDEKNF